MTESELVQIEWPQPGVALLRLNRPERLNALSPDLVGGHPRGAHRRSRPNLACRVIILTGAGRGFCAGLDLQATTELERRVRSRPGRMLEGQERFSSMIRRCGHCGSR